MEQSQRMKIAWVDENKQIISFQRMNGAIIYTASEADFCSRSCAGCARAIG